jgi:hypothetical protein
VDPNTGTSSQSRTKDREEHKKMNITDRDLAKMEEERLAMLNPIIQKYGGQQSPNTVQKIKQAKMGKVYKG